MFDWIFTKTPLIFLVQSFWRDEAYSYFLAKKNVLEIVALSLKDFSPPLYYLILHYWIGLFGGNEIALRSLSLMFFWATIFVIFLILNEVFKFRFGKSLLYLAFFAVNPILVYFAFETRMYSQLAFFSTLSYYAFFKRNPRLYLLSTVLGLYTHYFMIFVLIAQYLVSRFKQKSAILFFVPWMIVVFFNRLGSSASFWIGKMSPLRILTFLGEIYTGYEPDFSFFNTQVFYLSLAIMAVILYGVFISLDFKKHDQKMFSSFFLWGVGIPLLIVGISFFKPVFLPRYLIYSAIGLTFLIVFILEKLPVYPKVFLVAFFFAFSLNYQKLQIAKRIKWPIRQTLSEITSLMKKDDVIYVSSELDYFTVNYYLVNRGKKVFIYGKSLEEIPDYIGKVLVEKNRITTDIPLYPNRAFIILPNGSYDIQSTR